MKVLIRYGFVLGLICLLAGGLLALVNALTQPKILAQANAEEEKSLTEVLPCALRFDPIKSTNSEVIYYKAYDKDNQQVGVAFKAQGKGYSSIIETMVGMSLSGKILAIKIITQNETPGLGNRVTENQFLNQFMNKDILELNKVQAITGASISSAAVIKSVEKKAQEIKELIENGK